jgi:hypothetical protein
MRRKQLRWRDLPKKKRARFAAQGIVQVALTAWALWDLRHRPASEIRGSKRLWTLLAFVQPVGPVAYLLFGRER